MYVCYLKVFSIIYAFNAQTSLVRCHYKRYNSEVTTLCWERNMHIFIVVVIVVVVFIVFFV